jgi:hypothetical protein
VLTPLSGIEKGLVGIRECLKQSSGCSSSNGKVKVVAVDTEHGLTLAGCFAKM